MATSRRACPRPIGELTSSTRRSRARAGTQLTRPGRGPASDRTKSRISRLTRTGSRTVGAWPPPGIETSEPPVHAATATPPAYGVTASASPCTTSTGQRTARQIASASASVGSAIPGTVSIRVSGSVSSPQPTRSSNCFVECGSDTTRDMKNSTQPRKSARQ